MGMPLKLRFSTLALCAASLLPAGCTFNRAPLILAETKAEKVKPDVYRKKIVEWANRYYAEPASVRYLAHTDPVRIRESAGREVWLVCVELDARERGGPYMGRRRIAVGFGDAQSAPMERSGYDLTNEDCDAPQLVWRAWSGPRRG
jgi:hypothetical protein